MLCEKCGKRNANTHIERSINGNRTALNLCAECVREEGLDRMFEPMHFDFDHLFENAFESFFSSSFFQDSFFGRNAFYNRTDRDRSLGGVGIAEKEATVTTDSKTVAGNPALRKKNEILKMRVQLNKAVANQEFEQAAKLRDQIRNLTENE